LKREQISTVLGFEIVGWIGYNVGVREIKNSDYDI